MMPLLTDDQIVALREVMVAFDAADQSMVPADMREKGWVYRDLPGWMADEYWNKFLAAMGPDNYRIVAMSAREGAKRGQFFLSPQAIENLITWRKQMAANQPLTQDQT